MFFAVAATKLTEKEIPKDPNLIEIKASDFRFRGKNSEDVFNQLEKIGFNNIEYLIIDDLTSGWLTKNGDVETVTIDGIKDFEDNAVFHKNDKVIISYHTFPIDDAVDKSICVKDDKFIGFKEDCNNFVNDISYNNNDKIYNASILLNLKLNNPLSVRDTIKENIKLFTSYDNIDYYILVEGNRIEAIYSNDEIVYKKDDIDYANVFFDTVEYESKFQKILYVERILKISNDKAIKNIEILNAIGIEEYDKIVEVVEGQGYMVECIRPYADIIIVIGDDGLIEGAFYKEVMLYSSESNFTPKNVKDYILSFDEMDTLKKLAEKTILNVLKSPSSAKFPGGFLNPYESWAFAKEGDIYKVSSYVDAENSFGVKIRSKFYIEIHDGLGGEGHYEKVVIDGKTIIG